MMTRREAMRAIIESEKEERGTRALYQLCLHALEATEKAREFLGQELLPGDALLPLRFRSVDHWT
jgi:hypothetical protein